MLKASTCAEGGCKGPRKAPCGSIACFPESPFHRVSGSVPAACIQKHKQRDIDEYSMLTPNKQDVVGIGPILAMATSSTTWRGCSLCFVWPKWFPSTRGVHTVHMHGVL